MEIKTSLITILVCTNLLLCFGQINYIDCTSEIDTLTGLTVYTYPDSIPTPKGGEKLLVKELTKLDSPLRCSTIYGKIFVAFIVDTEGNINGKRVLRDIEETDFADQVFKLVEQLEWMPGTCQGEKVPTVRILGVRIDFQ